MPTAASSAATAMENITNTIPLAADGEARVVVLGEDIVDAYVQMDAAIPHGRVDAVDDAPVTFAYTPMHGVGLDTLRAVFAHAGLPAPDVVVEQAEPWGAIVARATETLADDAPLDESLESFA